jgi:hypothetical protein
MLLDIISQATVYIFKAHSFFFLISFFYKLLFVHISGEMDGPIKDTENKHNISAKEHFVTLAVAIFVLMAMSYRYIRKS